MCRPLRVKLCRITADVIRAPRPQKPVRRRRPDRLHHLKFVPLTRCCNAEEPAGNIRGSNGSSRCREVVDCVLSIFRYGSNAGAGHAAIRTMESEREQLRHPEVAAPELGILRTPDQSRAPDGKPLPRKRKHTWWN